MDRCIEFRTNMRSTSDVVASSDVREGSLVDLEDELSDARSAHVVVGQSNIDHSVDDSSISKRISGTF